MTGTCRAILFVARSHALEAINRSPNSMRTIIFEETNMSALYQMRYHGVAGNGHGACYIGNGKVLGVDITGARYLGSYTQAGAALNGSVTLTSSGGTLVTGQ